jgi:hypothetical protein
MITPPMPPCFPCRSAYLYMGVVVNALICLRLARYMRIHVGLKAFYQVRPDCGEESLQQTREDSLLSSSILCCVSSTGA